METTGVDSRVVAGGGPGAAGELAKPDVHNLQESTRLTHCLFLSLLLHLSVSLMNVVVVKMFIVVWYRIKKKSL